MIELEETYRGVIAFADFGRPLRDAIARIPGAAPKGRPMCEESLETFVALHFTDITGAQAIAMVTSRPMNSDPDVLAIDDLGRVHVVELKKKRIREGDMTQAEQYMLRFGFLDAADYIEDWQPERENWAGNRLDRVSRLAAALLGVWADEDPGLVGFGRVRKLIRKQPAYAEAIDRAFKGKRRACVDYAPMSTCPCANQNVPRRPTLPA